MAALPRTIIASVLAFARGALGGAGALKLMACVTAALLGVSRSETVRAADLGMKYAHMAPIEAYLMDPAQEIALARSAAPDSISHNATILVLGRHGYETAAKGSNGFVCMVERGWLAAFDWPEQWNPKIRGADCLNPPAARSVVPLAAFRTDAFLAGRSTLDVIEEMKTAFRTKALPGLEPGAMSYMLSKDSYLTDDDDHNMPHLMFFVPTEDKSAWGAGETGSPVDGGSYWFVSQRGATQTGSLPPMSVFIVAVSKWSDGTPAAMHRM